MNNGNGNGHDDDHFDGAVEEWDEVPTVLEGPVCHPRNAVVSKALFNLSAHLNILSIKVADRAKGVAKTKRMLETWELSELAEDIRDGAKVMVGTATEIESAA